MVRGAALFQPIRRPLWDAGGTPVALAGRGAGREEPGRHKLYEGGGVGASSIPRCTDFRGGVVPVRNTSVKRGKNFHRIGLLEVLWKAVAIVLNLCLGIAIKFHDMIHGFWLWP